ncbi:MAG: PqqD family protein [Acidobacteria bacterium]|nr:PqqD family protein [Acidobacteriota bacterium]
MSGQSLPIGGVDVRPRARTNDLVIRELPDEELVYDLKTHNACCLNKSAAMVWKHCDGQLTISEIQQLLSRELHPEIDEDWVCQALRQLSQKNLLEAPVLIEKFSRRQAMRKLGRAAVLAPLITAIIVPTAQAGNTCVGQACSPSGINGVDCPCTRCCGREGSPTSSAPRVCQLFQALPPTNPCNADCMCLSDNCIRPPDPNPWTCA